MTIKGDKMKPFDKSFRFIKNTPRQINLALMELAKQIKFQMQLKLYENENIWKGHLVKSLKVKNVSKTHVKIVGHDYGLQLDHMQPHYVSLKNNRKLQNWVKTRPYGLKTISRRSRVRWDDKGIPRGAVYVTPHPFIEQSVYRGLDRFEEILKRKINQSIN
jgi:hypothetical protein